MKTNKRLAQSQCKIKSLGKINHRMAQSKYLLHFVNNFFPKEKFSKSLTNVFLPFFFKIQVLPNSGKSFSRGSARTPRQERQRKRRRRREERKRPNRRLKRKRPKRQREVSIKSLFSISQNRSKHLQQAKRERYVGQEV